MSQSKAKYVTTAAFPEPNYTQTPNNFFDMIPDMEHSEVNVTLVLIRETFGYHRTHCKMGITKLAEAAGLSRNATKDGAESAERRGTFRRTNPDESTEAEWELVVGQPVTHLNECPESGQPVTPTQSTSDRQVGVKESKESKEIGVDTPSDNLPLDWKIANDMKITEKDLQDEKLRNMKDSANLIATGFGINSKAAYEIAYTFMVDRWIVISTDKVKGQRKAVKEMLEMHVLPEHVTKAVKDLTAKHMTITDLFSISKTAIDLANPAPEEVETKAADYKPQPRYDERGGLVSY